MRKVTLTASNSKGINFIDETELSHEHKCSKPKWRFLSSKILGDPIRDVKLWVSWECQNCRLQETVEKTINGLINLEVIDNLMPFPNMK